MNVSRTIIHIDTFLDQPPWFVFHASLSGLSTGLLTFSLAIGYGKFGDRYFISIQRQLLQLALSTCTKRTGQSGIKDRQQLVRAAASA